MFLRLGWEVDGKRIKLLGSSCPDLLGHKRTLKNQDSQRRTKKNEDENANIFILYNIQQFIHTHKVYIFIDMDMTLAWLLLVMVSYRLWKELWGRINYLTKLETTKPQQGAMQCTREKGRSYVK